MADNILKQFHEGRKIRSFKAFFDLAEYKDNKLTEEQKRLWVSVFETFFSRGDSSLNRDNLALGFIETINSLNLGIKMEIVKAKKADLESEDENDEEPVKERFHLIESREGGIEYLIMDDPRKIEVFESLRTEEVFYLQYDWVIFHFGSKVAMYVAKIEQFKTLLVEVSRPLTGDIEKRESKMVLRTKMNDTIEVLQESIDRIRWELFGITEEKIKDIQTGNRQQDLTRRRKEHLQTTK